MPMRGLLAKFDMTLMSFSEGVHFLPLHCNKLQTTSVQGV